MTLEEISQEWLSDLPVVGKNVCSEIEGSGAPAVVGYSCIF